MTKLSLPDLQKQMIDFLIDDDAAIEKNVVTQGRVTNKTRLNIYKNAYQVRLKEVIDNDHQMLGLYLGDDLFEQMVTEYIALYPSNYTSLRHFADQLPTFLTKQYPFKDHLIISEIASFERYLLTAFDAADVELFSREALQKIPDNHWPELIFHFHPSVQLAHFNWNSVESWQALKREQSPAPAENKQSVWLIWRNRERLTEFRSLSQEELGLIQMILAGNNFSQLCEQLLLSANEDEVAPLAFNYLITWIDQGVLRAT
jgi:hypothetical protein